MKIAMIGAGGIGQTHIENIRRIPGAQITDICDPSPRAKAVADELNAAWFTDDADMLESTQAQVTPNSVATIWVVTTLKRTKPAP